MEPPSTSASLTTQTQMTSGAGGIAPTQIVGGNTSQTGTTNPTTQGVSSLLSPTETVLSPGTNTGSLATSREEEEDSTNHSSDCKSPGGTRCCNSLVKYESIVSIVPSASESFDTYLAKNHHHHVTSCSKHNSKQHQNQKHHHHHECCQCNKKNKKNHKSLARASHSLDTEIPNYSCGSKRRRHFTISGDEDEDEEEADDENDLNELRQKTQGTKSNQRWMKLRTTVQISSAIQSKKPPLKREDSFLKRFSTRQIPETQETIEDTGSEGAINDHEKNSRRRRRLKAPKTVVNPDENFYFYWLMLLTICVLYNLWVLIVRQSFPELQEKATTFWLVCDGISDCVFVFDVVVQLRTGYLEQGLMVYDSKKLAGHYLKSRAFIFDLVALIPLDALQFRFGPQPLLRFPRFFKVYRAVKYYYIVESRTVWPNLWRVVNLIHILLILAHWFGCFYYLLSEAEGFQGDWVYPYRPGDYATLTRKYLGSLYWSTLTLTTIGDLPTPETNAEYVFTITSYLIGVFIFATIVGQVGNVITNRNANRLEFERLLDGAKTYMRHHKVPGGMKRRVLRWYDYSWSRGRIQGGGDINTALGLLPDKLKTELALHVNLAVLKKVTIFQECQPEFLHDLVLKMKAYIFTPGDSICRKGEVAREMFIIADGLLEVLSETGKVLTCMKAGDFFGEIGILNLDGLNKRTADVRSVGYSELFSLSREDVLAAMKDYPEAQEILQTLGRKRLMEVRCVNKRHPKIPVNPANDPHAHVSHKGEDSSDNSASKRIVDKLKNDGFKGFKNALRKSSRTPTGRPSNESIELQPLRSYSSSQPSGTRTPKNVLKRMSHVKSDDTEETQEGKYDKVISPIGAGLPLLHRLRLLKEKQDREERAAKAPASSAPSNATSLVSLPSSSHSHVKSAISPQESIQEEPEQEVIGAGLPLLQRLKLLKEKQEQEARLEQSKLQTIPAGSSISVQSPTSPTIPGVPTTPPISSSSTLQLPASSPTKTVKTKVSFKDRIRSLQGQSDSNKVHQSSKSISSDNSDMKQHLIPPSSPTHGRIQIISSSSSTTSSNINSKSNNNNSKPSTAQTIKEKLKSFSNFDKLHRIDHSSSMSCVHTSSSAIVGSSSSSSIKPWSKLKLATVIGGSYTSLNNAQTDDSPKIRSAGKSTSKQTKSTTGSDLNLMSRHMDKSIHIQNEKASVSDSELKNLPRSVPKIKPKPKPIKIDPHPKNYQSVDDLSPEYGGLPFVKKLKILNERQKLAELESAIQTRSFSLDCTDSNNYAQATMEPLYRSYSEASCMARTTVTTKIHNNPIVSSGGYLPVDVPQQCLNSPLSPESNETRERRELKSILKKLSEDKIQVGQDETKDIHRLMRAQTLEGYVARHSKFTKSVTFNRNTLSSPPNSAGLPPMSPKINHPTTPPICVENTAFPIPDAIDQHLSQASEIKINSKQIITEHEYHQTMQSNGSPTKLPFFTAMSPNQRNIIKGGIEEHEYFGEILLGIKQVIQSHLKEVQGKFYEKFVDLEEEVKQRDLVIAQLQTRIHELEYGVNSEGMRSDSKDRPSSGESGSSNELPFMRGDSLDTIFASSPPSEGQLTRSKYRNRKRISPKHRSINSQSWESSDQDSFDMPKRRDSMVVSSYTGNLIPDSVILDMGTSTSSNDSQSDDEEAVDEEVEEEQEEEELEEEEETCDEDEDQVNELHSNDWEVRMLAAELDKRESKSAVDMRGSDVDESDGLLRRRRKRSYTTDTDYTDSDADMTARPRAGSLDQYNLRKKERTRGVFKAMSFDRDKDKL
uniref:CSON013459 protein n=1 Tax=Culicoides sonorensis TaxID=179676 RepID=A0A336M8E0_CULSO